MDDPGPLSRGCISFPKPNQRNDNINKHSCNKHDVYDWLQDIPSADDIKTFDCVEVRFKNGRKDFFRKPNDMQLKVGEIVATEASPGHDIGIVSLVGNLVWSQMRKKKVNHKSEDIKKIYRKAKFSDIEKWVSAIETELTTIHKARKIALKLNLDMKISDVEYQGDKTKAIFYYTADDRVDFREMIKIFAEEFMVRVEMRQIGVRQESSRLGGIGSCGRELCCSTWISSFKSVSTVTARVQQLSINPQKLAGQCSKLKCCLNYEQDVYIDALKDFPDSGKVLHTRDGDATHQKTDIFRGIMWYAYLTNPENLIPLSIETVKDIQTQNAKNIIPEKLDAILFEEKEKEIDYDNVVGQDDITRFDKKKNPDKKRRRK